MKIRNLAIVIVLLVPIVAGICEPSQNITIYLLENVSPNMTLTLPCDIGNVTIMGGFDIGMISNVTVRGDIHRSPPEMGLPDSYPLQISV